MRILFKFGKAELLGNIYPVDNFDVYSDDGVKIFDGSKIYAFICDRNWFKIKPIDQFMESQYNANNRAMQYFLNNIKLYEFSLFANAICFCSEASSLPATALTFKDGTPSSINVGEKVIFEVSVTPTNTTSTITMTSSNESYASVTKIDNTHFEVEGLLQGDTILTISDGTLSDSKSIDITTKIIPITWISDDLTEISLTTEDTLTFSIRPTDANQPLYFISSNNAVFTATKDELNNTKVTLTPVADGTAELIVTTGSLTHIITVNVDV